MNQPHKHAKLIKEWADGAEIQYRSNGIETDIWKDCWGSPSWSDVFEWRVKPQPHPKQEFIDAVNQGKQIQYISKITGQWNDYIPATNPVEHLSTSYEWHIKPEDIVIEEEASLYSKSSVRIDHNSIENNVQLDRKSVV